MVITSATEGCRATEESRALLQGGGGGATPSKLAHLLHKALEHAAGLLHETAVNEIYVRSQLCHSCRMLKHTRNYTPRAAAHSIATGLN
jgi:hypothetical protein